ncbi:hypothetical protein [Pelagibacterium xiamenense]|uniref:hypothetical protein n=1 Tax=Pelagibacterium xiamenense TaxID=2901140 RepID=UPI001E48BD68|nr:hypothetical protein [Pelagibacterium xiamenense]MCD7059335.1 hypothetical protein [Pelagibacterium xiamenense]
MTKVSPQRKTLEMEARQREALRQEELVLEATRAKTARLRALRLEKEAQDQIDRAAAGPVRRARKKPARG